jgi:hypothetical protein
MLHILTRYKYMGKREGSNFDYLLSRVLGGVFHESDRITAFEYYLIHENISFGSGGPSPYSFTIQKYD